ncbi:regulatory-associated protein of mTOR-like [Nilaparvata lugens]|uniref:regulatory-associated protein of mTOR-like n=1 Tax=Nilaparvata lugens TaxID=108931 RepID=UPI00193C9CB0|nr:regulatory-associated protein of mTOR-like [Nilaparvata lugens]
MVKKEAEYLREPCSGSGVGLVMSWDQHNQQLVAGGDCRLIRIWDASKELKAADLPTGADSCVTCLSIDNNSSEYLRNAALRKEAKEEQRRSGGRPDTQLISVRTAQPPTTLLFHPYEPHLLYASKDAISAWDYQNNSRICSWRVGSGGSAVSGRPRVTALDFVNAHDTQLVAAGCDDGAVRLWMGVHAGAGSTLHLVTAWMALPQGDSSTTANAKHQLMIGSQGSGSGVGLVMSWDQHNQQLVAGGDCRLIRIWDASKELKAADLPTGADSCVTCLSIDNNSNDSRQLLAAGYGDGSVRLFDRRLPPNEACVKTYREHTSWVVNVDLRTENGTPKLLSGCVAGDVRSFDTRRNSSDLAHKTVHGMTAMATHRSADIFACVSANQLINVVDRNATSTADRVTLIKYHEWFMTARFGPVSCLAFHPLRALLAAGSVDSTLVVYAPAADPRLR